MTCVTVFVFLSGQRIEQVAKKGKTTLRASDYEYFTIWVLRTEPKIPVCNLPQRCHGNKGPPHAIPGPFKKRRTKIVRVVGSFLTIKKR